MKLARRGLLGAFAALSLAKTSAASQGSWPGALTMGTGLPGGSFTIFGPAWGKLITEATDIDLAYRSTDGSSANLLLIEQSSIQLGLCSLPAAIQARSGTGDWTAGARMEQFRVLFPAYSSILQIIAPANGTSTLAGLAAQPIGAGPSTIQSALLKQVFTNLGISPSRIEEGDYAQQLLQLMRGELAACAFFGAPPVPAIKAIATNNRLRLIGFSQAQAQQAIRLIPGLSRMILKAGTFPGQTINVGSIGTVDLAIGTVDLPDRLAEAATLTALRHRAQLGVMVPAATESLSLKPIQEAGLPFHPGAIKALHKLGYHGKLQ